MTVETEVTRVIVEGNGVTTSFSYTFPIPGASATDQTNAELLLLGTDSSITVLADNLWGITGVSGTSGTFTYSPAITTGAFLVLNRIVPYLQTTELTAQGAYSPAVVMAALDNLAFQTEQLNTRALQAIRAPITDAALSDLPTAELRANSFMTFDDNGDVSTASSTNGLPTSILVGTNSTHATLTTELLMTGSAVSGIVTVNGVTTATLAAVPGGSSGDFQINTAGAFAGLTPPIPVNKGGTGTTSPGLVQGSNITITGSWPNQTIASSAGSGGGLVFVESHTASGSTSLDFTTGITSTFDDYEFRIVGLVPATDNTDLQILFSTNSGSSWLSSNYGWSRNAAQLDTPSASGIGGAVGDTKILVFPQIPNNAAQGLSGNFSLYDPLSTTMNKRMTGLLFSYFNSAALVRFQSTNSGLWEGTTAVNAVRFIMSSGNITKGTIRLYGLSKT